jgi:energy-coupling factor transport system ATP-binding protein
VLSSRVVAVPQNPDLSLFCETVEEELAFAPVDARVSAGEMRNRVEGALSALSLGALRDRAPQALSRGQRLRTAVAAALTALPDVLLLDEPTAGQDRDQVERMFEGIPTEVAILFACHDPEVVLRHASRLLVLDEGQIREEGPPAETLRRAVARGLPLRMPL